MSKENNNNKDKMTIEDLAVMMQNEFLEVNNKMQNEFLEVDKRFSRVDEKFEELKGELKGEIRENRTAIDKMVKINEDNKQEITMMGNRVSRNKENIATLAEATDTEIEN